MKMISKLLAGSALALMMSAASAQAAVYVAYSLDGGTTKNQVVFDADDGAYTWSGTNLGGFETLRVEGDAFDLPALLHSASVETNTSGAAAITFFVTRTDLSAPDYPAIRTFFTGNTPVANYTVKLSTFLDAGNGVYTEVTPLSSVTYGQGADSDTFEVGGLDLSGDFSITQRYDISTTNGGSSSPTISQTAIPEPGTWALMILGFGGAGAMLRSSRRRVAVTA